MLSLKDQAYEAIKEKIITCQMLPGDIINERDLIAETGCGRTPVHEALSLLAREGLVRILPRRGMFVSEVSIKDIHDLYELKMEIEPLIVRMYGAEIPKEKLREFREVFHRVKAGVDYSRVDAEFHNMILSYCSNRYYKLIMEIVADQSQRIRVLTNEEPHRTARSNQEHMEVIDALLSDDIEGAAQAMQRHYENSLENILKFGLVSKFVNR